MASKESIALKIILISAIISSPLIYLDMAFSQTNPTDSSLADREQERLKELPPEEKAPALPKVKIEEEKPTQALIGAEAEIKFRVTKITVEGSSVFTQEELGKIVAPYENNDLSLKDLNSVAEQITNLYFKNGYLTSRAFVPPQNIEAGAVTIKIFEGKLGEIEIEGNRFFKSALISRRFNRLKGRILKEQELRRVLLFLDQNPDLEVRAIMKAGKLAETTDLVLKVKDTFPHHLSYEFNNQGTRLTGNFRQLLTYSSSYFLVFNDSLSMRFPFAEYGAVQGVSTNYSLPLNEQGTQLGLGASLIKVKMGREYKASSVKSTSQDYTTYLEHPLFAGRQLASVGRMGFEFTDSITRAGKDIVTKNKLRVLNLRLAFNEQDKIGRANLSGGIDIGLPHLWGATKKDNPFASPFGSSGSFIIYQLGVTRLQVLPLSSYLIWSLQGQYTNHILPGPKRFYLGGAYSVRGYPESDQRGDSGINMITELRLPCFIIPGRYKFKELKIRDMFQLAFFTDLGWANDIASRDSFLLGTGLGFRLVINKYVVGRFDIAWPIGDPPSEEKDDKLRLHFSLAFQF